MFQVFTEHLYIAQKCILGSRKHFWLLQKESQIEPNSPWIIKSYNQRDL